MRKKEKNKQSKRRTKSIIILTQCGHIFSADFIPAFTCAGRSRLGTCRMKTHEAHLLALDIMLEI